MLPTMRAPGDSGLRGLSDLRYEMDRLFEDAMRTPLRRMGEWSPAADLTETSDAYELAMELPGFDREDIDVTVERGILSVSGQRSREEEKKGSTYHLRERAVGRFSRSFSLPSSVQADDVKARFENGVLHVSIPKAPEAKSRKIEVEVG